MLRVINVTKKYRNTIANDNITFDVSDGQIAVLLGPNGAGKSTIIKCISGLLRFSGHIEINGFDNKSIEAKRLLGYIPEMPAIYDMLTVEEHLEFIRRAYRMQDDGYGKQLMERFELWDKKDKLGKELSKGMQQKIQFITTVIHKPELLIFDEPFSGFDPVNANLLKQEILELKEKGATVIFSTHNMNSVEELCDEITLINRSKAVLSGHVHDIRERHKKNLFRIRTAAPLPESLSHEYKIIDKRQKGDYVESIVMKNGNLAPSELILHLARLCQLSAFEEILPTMNEIFIDTVNANLYE